MATDAPDASAFPKALKFKTFKQRNPDYNADFWARCRALYSGGPALLENKDLLGKIMPKHAKEDDGLYQERQGRAFYIPYAGSIIDKIVAELMAKPVSMEIEHDSEESALAAGKTEESLPEFYVQLMKNCAKPGGKKCDVAQFAREQIFTALQCRTAWALVDMPKAPEQPYPNRAAQEAAGALNAYFCPIDPECVIDWEEDESGELLFALIEDKIAPRKDIKGDRNTITLRYRYYTRDGWAVYELTYNKTLRPQGPSDNDDVILMSEGKHSFERVPVRRMTLPDGLWAMGKLEAMARAHMNQRNALSWGQLKALFPVPILYAAPPNPADPVSEDAARTTQRTGPGYMWVLAEKDRMEYFSPDTAPYEMASQDLNVIRDEMHRVLHHMAMSVDNSGAALQRSADSKAIDQAAASVILRALGMYLREHLEELFEFCAIGRDEEINFCAKGMDNFDDVTLTALVADAVALETVQIPSATFQKKFKMKVAKLALGADANDEDLDEIYSELDDNITADTFAAQADADLAGHQARGAKAEAEAKDPTGDKAAKMAKQMIAKGSAEPKEKPEPKG